MRIVVAGATGFVGRPLVRALREAGHEITVLTRRPEVAARALAPSARAVAWDGRTVAPEWAAEIQQADAVVNLAGANIGTRRWTQARKRELIASRIDSTRAIVAAIAEAGAGRRPKVLVTASGIDYYGDRDDEQPLCEDAPPGSSFLARLCVDWEAAAREAEPHGVRVASVRTALAVGKGAFAITMLLLPFRLFAGGPLGSGRQWFTWIHLDDLIGLYRLALEDERVQGPLNAVAPDVRRQRDVAAAIGRVLHRPSWLPAPGFMLRLALGERADLLLHGRRAAPCRAQELGYTFRYPRLEEALATVA